MKKLFILMLVLPFVGAAQNQLFVEGISPNLYLTHLVAAKDNYYSIGRIYNVSPKEIASFNKLQLDKGLDKGQSIKIPLSNTNFSQNEHAGSDETLVPVYYQIKDKDGLYRVAKNHNDVKLETLRKWNNLKDDAIKSGSTLMIGYLKVKSDLSVLAKNASSISNLPKETDEKPVVAEPVKTVVVNELLAKQEVKPLTPKENTESVKQESVKKPEAQKNIQPVFVEQNTGLEKSAIQKSENESGAFQHLFQKQMVNSEVVEISGMAGIFKSTSGWNDQKYYCLFNHSSPGMIVKITNTVNGKYIFAKVLDQMPDIKKNEGLLLVLSNAAVDVLGAGIANFTCSVSYIK